MRYGPKHEESCKFDVVNGCPGDPMCEHTMLARIHDRCESLPAMRKLQKVLRGFDAPLAFASFDAQYEALYLAVCFLEKRTPEAPVEGWYWNSRHYRMRGNGAP